MRTHQSIQRPCNEYDQHHEEEKAVAFEHHFHGTSKAFFVFSLSLNHEPINTHIPIIPIYFELHCKN